MGKWKHVLGDIRVRKGCKFLCQNGNFPEFPVPEKANISKNTTDE